MSVSSAWYESPDVTRLVHLWLGMDELGEIMCTCEGDGDVGLAVVKPYVSYDMPELLGHVVVDQRVPEPLGDVIGNRILAVTSISDGTAGMVVGFTLDSANTSVAIVNLGDDLTVGTWPNPNWTAMGISS